jgi:hypothetical protein
MPDALPTSNGSGGVHFLPAFDEFMVSYKDRTASLEPDNQKIIITGHGIFKPIIVFNGQIKGIWKRTFKKDTVLIEPKLFADAGRISLKNVQKAARKYSFFEGQKMQLL